MYVICYHNVLADPLDLFDRAAPRLTVERFTRQVEYLSEFFKILPLPEAIARLQSGESTARVAVVTFDDAYYGVYAYARPALRRLGIPAAVFAVTTYAEQGGRMAFAHDETEIAFRLSRVSRVDLDFLGEGGYDLAFESARIAAMKIAKKHLKATPVKELPRVRAELFRRLEVAPGGCQEYARGRETYRQMGWEELRELYEEGWHIGSHTRTHQAVGQADELALEDEVCGSAADLRARLGIEGAAFAYPYGEMPHIGVRGPAAARAAGYCCALTMEPGLNDPWTDRFLLRRLPFEHFVYLTNGDAGAVIG